MNASATPPADTGPAPDPSPGEPPIAQRVIKDLVAGLTVSFVAISLGAAFGAFAGRGAMSGILSAGVICFICALFGGTRIQCSGPTAPMSAVMLGAVSFAMSADFGNALPGVDPNQFLNIVLVLTGAVILLMGILRLGKFITIVPKVVISGFMNGIAVLIWIGEAKKLLATDEKTALLGGQGMNLAIATITLVLCFLLPRLIKKVPLLGHYIPGTLAVIVAVSAGVHLAGLEIALVQMGAEGGSFVERVREHFPREWSWDVVKIALPFVGSLALLAYLDTLLTALVVDKKVKEDLGLDETTSQNKELAAQGLANGLVGLFGGIPGAQATIRSVLILKEGATMRLAGVAAGAFVLIEMLALQDLIAKIPSAVFAGVLIKVGYDVMDWPPLYAAGRRLVGREPDPDANVQRVAGVDLFFIVGTTVLTIAVNLNVAVIAFVILFYVLKKAKVNVPDLPDLADQGEEWVSDHQEGMGDADLKTGLRPASERLEAVRVAEAVGDALQEPTADEPDSPAKEEDQAPESLAEQAEKRADDPPAS